MAEWRNGGAEERKILVEQKLHTGYTGLASDPSAGALARKGASEGAGGRQCLFRRGH